jgi:ubiquinone/menaquinone biosynthesis C-methylase UbiE
MGAQITRVLRSKQQARASYDRMSQWYDLLADPSERKYRELGLQKLNVQPGETVLEIGFGTGHSLLDLAQRAGLSGHVDGIDLSMGMCRVAGARIACTGPSRAPIHLACADATALPYPARSFDALFMSFTLELFDTPEIPHVLGECKRVLCDEGRLCAVSLAKRRGGVVVRLYEWLHEVMPAYVDCRPIYVRAALQEAGFAIRDATQTLMWGLPVDVVLAQTGSP